LFGGQDTPKLSQLAARWRLGCGAALPQHRPILVEWPRDANSVGRVGEASIETSSSAGIPKPIRTRAGGPFEDAVARALTGIIRTTDERLQFLPDGRPANGLARAVDHFARYSLSVLYDRDGLAGAVLETATKALRAHCPDVIVAHSFGGTIALRAAWELWREGQRGLDFCLVTLGTASGPTVVRSPLFRDVPRSREGRLALPPNVRNWYHFWSRNDVWVAAPSLPHQFEGVTQIEVDTGPLALRGRPHALVSYLRAPEVFACLRAHLGTTRRSPTQRSGLIEVPPASMPTLNRVRTG
jgi:hypothetical protein